MEDARWHGPKTVRTGECAGGTTHRVQVEMSRARDAGFTLLEILIVLVVAGGLLVIATRPISRELRSAKTRSAVNQFTSIHGLARATAVRYGRTAELHIDAANAQFWVEVDTSRAGGVTDTAGTIHGVGSPQFAMTSNRSLVCFDGRGLATTVGPCEAGDLIVTFSLGGRSDTVTASLLGKILR